MTPERQHGKTFCLQGDFSSIESQLYMLCLRKIFAVDSIQRYYSTSVENIIFGDKTVLRQSYVRNVISYTDKSKLVDWT